VKRRFLTFSFVVSLTLLAGTWLFSLRANSWAEQTLASMSLRDKVGQLFMVDMRPHIEEEHGRLARYFHVDALADNAIDYEKQVTEFIMKNHIGGIIFMKGTAAEQIDYINNFQQKSTLPLLIVQDAECGPGQRLSDVEKFPLNMTLGALSEDDDVLIEEMGALIGKQLRYLGVHLNFGPVVDINNNPDNPIINHRSFGENKHRVAQKGVAYMKGLHQMGIMVCLKHYPGHGNVAVDSHKALPSLTQSLGDLKEMELYPFENLINEGADSVMTAHLTVPKIDATPNLSATLSPKIIESTLRGYLNFGGLVFADSMMMNAITDHFSPEEAAIKTLEAGVDVVLMSPDIPAAIDGVVRKAESDSTFAALVDQHALRVLKAKEHVGLQERPKSLPKVTPTELNSPTVHSLKKELFERAVTLVRNNDAIFPLLKKKKATLLQLSSNPQKLSTFSKHLADNDYVDVLPISWDVTAEERQRTFKHVALHDNVTVAFHDMSQHPSQRFGLTDAALDLVNDLSQQGKKISVIIFGNPYSLKHFEDAHAIIVAYEDVKEAQRAATRILIGELQSRGTLPVTASSTFKEGMGITTS